MAELDEFGGAVVSNKAREKQRKRIADLEKRLEGKTAKTRTDKDKSRGKVLFDDQMEKFSDPEGRDQGKVPYFTLLDVCYEQLYSNNPKMMKKNRCRILPPNVTFSGRKKTLYTNMKETAQQLNREFDHLKSFLFAELGTTGNIDGTCRLILKGRFRVNQVQSVLSKYASQYVICKNCGSPDTKLNKDKSTRLYSLICSNCGSQRRVVSVRSGYSATMRGERRAARNAVTQ